MAKARLDLGAEIFSLEALDHLQADVLLLGVFDDDRPLKGAAGYCDWRLNGRLSRMLQSGSFKSQADEVLLTDTAGRIPVPRVLLFGLGPRQALDLAAFRSVVRMMLVTAKKMGSSHLAMEMPGVNPGPLDPRQGLDALLKVAHNAYPACRITLMVADRRNHELAEEEAKRDPNVRWMLPVSNQDQENE